MDPAAVSRTTGLLYVFHSAFQERLDRGSSFFSFGHAARVWRIALGEIHHSGSWFRCRNLGGAADKCLVALSCFCRDVWTDTSESGQAFDSFQGWIEPSRKPRATTIVLRSPVILLASSSGGGAIRLLFLKTAWQLAMRCISPGDDFSLPDAKAAEVEM